MKHGYREGCLVLMALGIACSSGRSYYTHAEVPKLGGEDAFPVAPGPWPRVPAVLSDSANVPGVLRRPLPNAGGLAGLLATAKRGECIRQLPASVGRRR